MGAARVPIRTLPRRRASGIDPLWNRARQHRVIRSSDGYRSAGGVAPRRDHRPKDACRLDPPHTSSLATSHARRTFDAPAGRLKSGHYQAPRSSCHGTGNASCPSRSSCHGTGNASCPSRSSCHGTGNASCFAPQSCRWRIASMRAGMPAGSVIRTHRSRRTSYRTGMCRSDSTISGHQGRLGRGARDYRSRLPCTGQEEGTRVAHRRRRPTGPPLEERMGEPWRRGTQGLRPERWLLPRPAAHMEPSHVSCQPHL